MGSDVGNMHEAVVPLDACIHQSAPDALSVVSCVTGIAPDHSQPAALRLQMKDMKYKAQAAAKYKEKAP